MMKALAVVLYFFGTLLAGFECLVYFSANAHLSFSLSVNYLAWSFVPMVTLMALSTYAQVRKTRVLWVLPPVGFAAAVTLLLAMLNHAFPTKAAVWSIAHLVAVVVGGVLVVVFARQADVSTH